LTFFIGFSVFSQSDTLNQFNSNKERTGWWITYLDKDLAITSDTTQAKYYRYSYFDGAFNYYSMGPIGAKKSPVIGPVSLNSDGEIPPLHGVYKANYTNGQTQFVLKADNGRFTEYLEYYKNGNLKTRYDYTKSCGKSPFEYCIYKYKKNGDLKMEGRLRRPNE
jgi:hypothetical protein